MICWFKSTYWDFLLCSSLKYPGKKFLPDSSVFNILSDILLMQSFNPYPDESDMHFKVSFSSSLLFLESLLSNEPVSWGFYSFGKYFFTYACALTGSWSKRTGRSSSARTLILTISRQTNRAKIFFIWFFFYNSTSYLSNLSTGQISGAILKWIWNSWLFL